NVFGVLAEDDHVGQLRALHGAGDTLEPAHGAQADIQIKNLAQGDVERADAAADGRGQRTLDADEVRLERLERLVRQPFTGFVERLLTGEDFLPLHLALPAVRLLDGGVEDTHAGPPDVRADTVALDEGEDRVVRNVQALVGHGDG